MTRPRDRNIPPEYLALCLKDLKLIDYLVSSVTSAGAIVVFAAALQTAAYLFSNQLTLRLFLLLGTIAYLIYYFNAAEEPLWAAIFGTTCIAITSIYGFLRVLADRSIWTIPKAHLPIYRQIGSIEPGAFRKLIKLATIEEFDRPVLLIEKGSIPEQVYFLIKGKVDIEKNYHRFPVDPFNFIGEISIMGGFEATATVHSRAGSTCVVWNRQKLLDQMQKDEKFRIAVEALFAKDMAGKLAKAVQVS